jgi:6-phosphogluconolactonase
MTVRVPTIDCTFANDAALSESFAQTVAANLRAAIDARGRALIGLSGGSTPREFLKHLSNQELDWSRVTVTLCDDRWVPPTSDRSNEHLLRETLLRNKAAKAAFAPLYVDAPDPESALTQVQANVAKLKLPFDVIVLGMGGDGHTASLFPGGDRLGEASSLDTSARALPMRAPDAPEPRITLTLSALIDTHALYLHIEGADKRAVFDNAMASDDSPAPIRNVLKASRVTPIVYWCP